MRSVVFFLVIKSENFVGKLSQTVESNVNTSIITGRA